MAQRIYSNPLNLPGRALQITREILEAKGLQLPLHVVLQADNTCREQRNSWTFLFSAWLVSQGVVRTVDEMFYRVGHTHNECDQRFYVLSAALSRQDTLETPQNSPTYHSNILRNLEGVNWVKQNRAISKLV